MVGDLLLSVDGHALSSPDELLDLMVGDRVGRPISFHVLRGGVPAETVVTIAER
jgi:S1-C subfamily serine protease